MDPNTPISAKPIRVKKENKYLYSFHLKKHRKLGYLLKTYNKSKIEELTPKPLWSYTFLMTNPGEKPTEMRECKNYIKNMVPEEEETGNAKSVDEKDEKKIRSSTSSRYSAGAARGSIARASGARGSIARASGARASTALATVRGSRAGSVKDKEVVNTDMWIPANVTRGSNYEGYYPDPFLCTGECFKELLRKDIFKFKPDEDPDEAPDMFAIREDPPPKNPKIMRTFKITLKETETLDLFFIPSSSAERDSPEGQAYIKGAQEREERKTLIRLFEDVGVQTIDPGYVDQQVGIPMPKRKNMQVDTGPANIFDDLEAYEEMKEAGESFDEGTSDLNKETLSSSDDEGEKKKGLCEPDERRIVESEEFQRVCLIIERMINSKESEGAQLCYNGRLQLDPLAKHAEFKHLPVFLWEFHNTYVEDLLVTSMSWNPVRKKIIAISYGVHYKDSSVKKGKVCVWNIKNTVAPERMYRFDSPVNFVEFSKEHPGLLCAAMLEGYIVIIDVTSKLNKVLFTTKGNTFSDYSPIWQVRWFFMEGNTSVPVCCTQNGKILKFRKDATFKESIILQLGWKVGTIKGVLQPVQNKNSLAFPKRPGILCIEPHPTLETIYLAGTEDGCIHTCSIHYFNHHLDVFAAHFGPVFHIQFHPHSDKIFLSTGGDITICIWVFGESTPLIQLRSHREFVSQAVWSPVHPPIIASVIGSYLEIWDVRRVQPEPVSSVEIPNKSKVTQVSFSPNGMNVLVGDDTGAVSVFALESLPFVPTDKERNLAEALKRNTDGDRIATAMLNKLGPPFSFGSSLCDYKKDDVL